MEQKNREEKRSEAKRRDETRRDEKRRDEKRRDETRREEKRRGEERREEKRRGEERRGEERRGEERRGEKRREEKRRREKVVPGRKVAKHCVFPMICGSGGSKSRLAKAAGAEPAGQMRDEKLHAVVARSTFRSQNVQSTPGPDHFWQLRCRKSARRCGAKHISKSKCTKHTMFGPLLEVEMSEKCTPLRREAHFEVKMHKAHHVRTTFGSCDVEKVHAVVARSTFASEKARSTSRSEHFLKLRCRKSDGIVARSRFLSQSVQSTPCSDHFWKLRCRKSARRCGAKHISKYVRIIFGSCDVEKVHAVVA